MSFAAFREAKRDLPGFALRLFPHLAAAMLLSKGLAVFESYPGEGGAIRALAFARALPHDLLFLGALAAAILLARHGRLPDRYRGIVAGALALGFAFGAVWSFVSAGFFVYLGAPLTVDLVLLAPSMMGWLLHSLTAQGVVLLALAGLSVGTGLVTALASRRPRLGPGPAWVVALALVLSGAALEALPATGYREASLRSLSSLDVLLPSTPYADVVPPAPTDEEQHAVTELLGPPRDEGARAFAALPRRRRNVLIWMWESVGERHLLSHGPLGTVRSPGLDRIEAGGSVRFSQAFTECPLSVQTMWAMLTGTSPPGSPMLYGSAEPLPAGRTLLASWFHEAGYRTSFFNGSDAKAWNEQRLIGLGGFDVFEQASTLRNRGQFRGNAMSIEARAVTARFFEWLDATPAEQPFFSLLWSIETHHPYYYEGMPPEQRRADDAARYLAAVEHSDRVLGELYDELQRRGLTEDTLLVVVGDHGEGIGRQPHPYDRVHSRLVYEDDLLVPLVFANPALPGTTVVDVPASHVDVYPTLLDLVGLSVPPGLDGVSLAGRVPPRIHYSRSVTWWPLAVRAGRFKLIQHRPDAAGELYDLAADPLEQHDLSGERPGVARALWVNLQNMSAARHRDDPSFQVLARLNLTSLWAPPSPSRP